MKKYTQHSPNVIHNRYSVTKVCIEFDRISLITNQKITVTIYIAIIMDLLKNNADYDSGHYDNIDEFKFFVENLKNDKALLNSYQLKKNPISYLPQKTLK